MLAGHYHYALNIYGRAINDIRNLMSEPTTSLRLTLIASLSIFCFENFHGHVRSALTTIDGAMQVLFDWMRKHRPLGKGKLLPLTSVVESEIITVIDVLERDATIDEVELNIAESFSAGLLPLLFLLMVRCREYEVGHEALEVLKPAQPRREGTWDSAIIVGIGERLLGSRHPNGKKDNFFAGVYAPYLDIKLMLPKLPMKMGMPQEQAKSCCPVLVYNPEQFI
ncbi:hypothetical protein G7Y89_g1459 [Cudoniella acicularis]|uniref:Uncharacterized protein n=1 Tax=Cudoniella acicularis TaxID=354080 RepID=A0A8H4RV92_9HELO|nr:hypothetical protein G7Y89_g1459 [Cudoniella acicularis]